MKKPLMTVSGIRGIVGESLDEVFISQLAYLQTITYGKGLVVVGRDTRPSGENFAKAVFRGIRAAGGVPIDLGIVPTPTVCFATKIIGANTGIILTASHNPVCYNGYKMVHRKGRLFRASECEEIYNLFRKGELPDESFFLGFSDMVERSVDTASLHIEEILSNVETEIIRKAGIKIAVDSINGAAGSIFPELLEKLGVEWVGVHNKLDGDFVHNPEPRPEHLSDLANLLKKEKDCWGGFVFDPDADRLATMGENGEPISEELTLAFALENLLSRQASDVAVNLSTSMVIDDVAKKFGVKVIRTKIGEANVVEAMEEKGCLYGGEGNGGVIYPTIVAARDGLTGLALILELMAKTGKKITQLAAMLPEYYIVKDKISCEGKDVNKIIEILTDKFSSDNKDLQDGLKIIKEYGWVHLRPSNTEPIIRCYAEASTKSKARELADMVMNFVKEIEG